MIKGYQTELLKIYEDIRKSEIDNLEKRKEIIKEELPEVLEIERKIGRLCIEVSLNAFKNKTDINKQLNELKEQITDLRMKKTELLVSHGYAMDYLDLHYHCDKCKDTGFIGSKKCSCYSKNLVKLYYNDSKLKDVLVDNNFKHFRLDFFDNHRNENNSKSPRHNMQDILETVHSFINNFNKSDENLLFYGNSGTGKTFLTYCIAKELLDKGNLVIYKTAEDLIRDLREIKYGNDTSLENLIYECDLLIIDDLGTEQMNDFSRSELFNLLNKKIINKKKMIISTNFSLEIILEKYSERISSRLLGNFTIRKFYGDDIRIKNNLKKIKN